MLGSKTIGAVYSTTKEIVRTSIAFILDLPKWMHEKLGDFKDHIATIRGNLQNFYQINLNLGLHHLRLGNINDAIFRFKLLEKFIAPNDKKANYYLGWCYFLKNKYAKALTHLALGAEKDKTHLANFIEHCDSKEEVPSKIWKEYRELTRHKLITKWRDSVANLPQSFITELFATMQELPKECFMLDLGCAGGWVGSAIDNKLQKNYHLTGVEENAKLIEIARHLREDKRRVYDDLREESIENFLQENKKNYDVVTSFNSFTFTKSLTPYLKLIYSVIKDGGYFAISLPKGNKTTWDASINEFIYDKEEVAKQLKLAKFYITDIKELELNKLSSYIMFICKK